MSAAAAAAAFAAAALQQGQGTSHSLVNKKVFNFQVSPHGLQNARLFEKEPQTACFKTTNEPPP
jgi:hypothetical protein